jgi:hypothetical protein
LMVDIIAQNLYMTTISSRLLIENLVSSQ